jgi:hypothetical protein
VRAEKGETTLPECGDGESVGACISGSRNGGGGEPGLGDFVAMHLLTPMRHFCEQEGMMDFPLFCSQLGRVPLWGCLTRLRRLAEASLLANVGKACSIRSTVPTPAGLLTLDGRGTELKKRSVVP